MSQSLLEILQRIQLASQKMPELRLGQLICNALFPSSTTKETAKLHYINNEDLILVIENFVSNFSTLTKNKCVGPDCTDTVTQPCDKCNNPVCYDCAKTCKLSSDDSYCCSHECARIIYDETNHVCGLSGFGALGDVCPACSKRTKDYEASRLVSHKEAVRIGKEVHEDFLEAKKEVEQIGKELDNYSRNKVRNK